MANNDQYVTPHSAYFRGIETGLKWLREMRDYEIESEVPGMSEIIPNIIGLIEADYMERIEKEKAAMLNG